MATRSEAPHSLWTLRQIVGLSPGMTCGHCVASVTEAVSKVDRVTNVDVDLDSGQVTVTSDAPLDDAAVAAAVDEAGYAVTP